MPSLKPRCRTALAARSLLTLLLLALITIAGTVGAARPAIGSAQQRQPNIVLIVTDDLDTRSLEFMPNVAALLGRQGTTFTNFIVSTPVCCPARATILRGQYAHNHGVLGNVGVNGGFSAFQRSGSEESTVATWLQEAGYRTALIGKYLNGYPDKEDPFYIPPGWDEWFVGIVDSGKYLRYSVNDNGHETYFGGGEENYSTDVFAARATAVMRDAAASGQPFFIALAPHAPHGPARPANRHRQAFAASTAPRPPSFNEADVSDKPAWLRQSPPFSAAEIAKIDEIYQLRLRSLLAVDEMVATLVEELRASGQLDNTYVVFTSDNGYHLGEHRIVKAKRTPYEEAIRVPLLMRGPGVAAGRVEERLTLNTDLAPTFAALAGVTAPGFVDGRSLVPLLQGEAGVRWRRAVLIEQFDTASSVRAARASRLEARGLEAEDEEEDDGRLAAFSALRTADLVYIELDSGERELYDLRADPFQLRNAVATADPDELTRLAAWLAELRGCAAGTCRDAEDAAP